MSAPDHQLRLQADGDGVASGPSLLGARMHLIVLAVGLALLLGVHHETVISLVKIWNRSDTFAHGFLVAPISCWLIWRERAELRDVPVAPSLLGVFAGLLAGFAWLLGELASADSVSQFALVGMVISLVWAVMGTRFARAITFPLGFLFFLVPFGEFLFPSMMDWTAHFVVAGLRLFGVPVFAEGRMLVIPSGHWSIVEGCSGVRYLIASVVVGSLYAYLTYRSLRRRLVFVALSVGLPVLANWIRAWGIVMLGHFSGNRIATGVDHVVYGWVFFAAVMIALFWIGARWREDDQPMIAPREAGDLAESQSGTSRSSFVLLVVALLAVLAWKPVFGVLDAQGRHGDVEFAALQASGAWRPVSGAQLPVWSPRYSGMRGELRAAWQAGEVPVGLYVAYYRDQGPGEELVNSENRVLKSKDPQWSMTSYGERDALVGDRRAPFGSIEMAGAGGRLMVWYGYWIGGRWTNNDYVAKLYLVASRLSGAGDDSAAVMVYAPYAAEEHGKAEAALESFMRDMGPAVGDMLAATMGR
ncbi:exosortase A [Azoarcus sp. KH32C]|uniref:exosortase A n=1 Tax=Azoarcus sp. KH32C TaxID=748247 RepID=UPI000238689C|nr:exosortase A [Azoarcus sp. KH32C]BAL25900.1 exosortase 1 [Azoarcus sp. KH32C]